MHILVTNDDGVQAPGLLALAQELRTLGKVTVFAPDHNWSASGHVKTMDRPLRAREVILADGTTALATDGAPSDSVALALLGVVKEKIDLVVSGINPHENIGHDVTYSGTVTAAMEAVIGGVPGIAISLNSPEEFRDSPGSSEVVPVSAYHPESLTGRGTGHGVLDYDTAASVARRVVEKVMAEKLPEGVLLNVNVPYLKEDELKGFMITRQGLRLYRDALDARIDPRGKPYYWIGGEFPIGVLEEGTDYGAIKAGYVSITPLQLDLTAREVMEVMKKWKWE
jgi:5'-nucleotidase